MSRERGMLTRLTVREGRWRAGTPQGHPPPGGTRGTPSGPWNVQCPSVGRTRSRTSLPSAPAGEREYSSEGSFGSGAGRGIGGLPAAAWVKTGFGC